MIEYLLLIFAIPLGIILAKITRHEKEIYSRWQYFPLIITLFAITAGISFTFDKTLFITLTFLFITTFVWLKA